MIFNFKNTEKKASQPVAYAPGKRQLSKIYWYLVLAMMLTPFAYIGFKLLTETYLMRAHGCISFGEMVVRAPVGAYVKKLLARPGESFEKGQVIVELRNPVFELQLEALTTEVETLKQKKAEFLADTSELDQILLSRIEAEHYTEECRKDLETFKDLKKAGLASITDLSKIRYDHNLAQQQLGSLAVAIAKYNLTKKMQAEEIFGKGIRETESRIRQLKVSIAMLSVRAPDSGNIYKLFVEQDEYVREGQELARISTNRDLHINAYIESKFISDKLRRNQTVTIIMPDNIRIPGIVSDSPVLAEIDPSMTGVIRGGKRMIVIRVNLKGELPERYRISGLPVDVSF